MQRQPEHMVTGRGVEDRRAVAARGVHHELSGLPGARGTQPGDQAREDVVRDRQQDQLGPGDDLLHGRDGYAGQQRRGPLPRLLADTRDGHQTVARLLERCTQDGADPAGADDADVEPGGSFTSHRQVAHARNASPLRSDVAYCP